MTAKPRKIILTGATGFLGSHLMAALLEQGDRLVVLGRSSKQRSLSERIGEILAWFGRHPACNQIETAEVDFLKPCCGLEETRCADADLIIHCASDTSFAETNRTKSIEANLSSLAGIIDLAAAGKTTTLHYISTAYSAGITDTPAPEAPVQAASFHNVYEETKALAEKEIADKCARHGIPYTIIRPSIVYGDSGTGRANHFNAIYHHVRALACIRDIYLNDIRNHGGRKSAAQGIHQDKEGHLALPLTLVLEKPGRINLIPVDYFVAATLAIAASGETDTIYHLTSPAPSTVEQLADYCERFLGIRGLAIAYAHGTCPEPNPAEELFNRFIEPYRPYLSDTRTFQRANAARATDGLLPPPFSYEIFRRCMEYAADANWGRPAAS